MSTWTNPDCLNIMIQDIEADLMTHYCWVLPLNLGKTHSPDIWRTLNNWYSYSPTSMLSKYFSLDRLLYTQGNRQGAILYSIFVDNFLISL